MAAVSRYLQKHIIPNDGVIRFCYVMEYSCFEIQLSRAVTYLCTLWKWRSQITELITIQSTENSISVEREFVDRFEIDFIDAYDGQTSGEKDTNVTVFSKLHFIVSDFNLSSLFSAFRIWYK